MNKRKKAFSLIEIIIALGLISIISLYLLPSLFSVYKNSKEIKDDSRLIFAMQESLEVSKNKDIGEFEEDVNGYTILVSVKKYDDKLNIVEVKKDNYNLSLVVGRWKEKPLAYLSLYCHLQLFL